jgi:hypothetical protein
MPWKDIVRILYRARADAPLVVPPGFYLRTRQRLLADATDAASFREITPPPAGGHALGDSQERPSPSPSTST